MPLDRVFQRLHFRSPDISSDFASFLKCFGNTDSVNPKNTPKWLQKWAKIGRKIAIPRGTHGVRQKTKAWLNSKGFIFFCRRTFPYFHIFYLYLFPSPLFCFIFERYLNKNHFFSRGKKGPKKPKMVVLANNSEPQGPGVSIAKTAHDKGAPGVHLVWQTLSKCAFSTDIFES